MASVIKEEIEDIRFIGGVYADIDRGFRACDYTASMQAFFPVLETKHKERFEAQTDPGGVAWKPLSPRTVREKGHDTILVRTGRLKASLVGRSSDSVREVSERGRGALFGSRVPYSIFHMTGGRHLPRREHVGMIDDTALILVNSVADESVESLKLKV